MQIISGGVLAPKGFKANGIHCGIRKNKTKKDLALIVSDNICTSASVYTTNLVKGAPILVTKENLKDGKAQAVIVNSGNANTCNANGVEIASKMCDLVEKHTGIKSSDVIVASTGVIGQPLDITPIENAMEKLVGGLDIGTSVDANEAIMTTDTIRKEIAVSVTIGGKEVKIGGIAKGSGMIHPNMATMLVFLTSDCNISSEMLYKAIKEDIEDSFNMVTIDGDTSTNDMLSILANGQAGNKIIDGDGEDYENFKKALGEVTRYLCRLIAKDGEGATKLLECKTIGAKDKATAKTVSKSVVSSSLFKAAMFGADANWGRVLCAIGYRGVQVEINKIDVTFKSVAGEILVCSNGASVDFDEDKAKDILTKDEIEIIINLKSGDAVSCAYGCDLTYDYVKINGDYRT